MTAYASGISSRQHLGGGRSAIVWNGSRTARSSAVRSRAVQDNIVKEKKETEPGQRVKEARKEGGGDKKNTQESELTKEERDSKKQEKDTNKMLKKDGKEAREQNGINTLVEIIPEGVHALEETQE